MSEPITLSSSSAHRKAFSRASRIVMSAIPSLSFPTTVRTMYRADRGSASISSCCRRRMRFSVDPEPSTMATWVRESKTLSTVSGSWKSCTCLGPLEAKAASVANPRSPSLWTRASSSSSLMPAVRAMARETSFSPRPSWRPSQSGPKVPWVR